MAPAVVHLHIGSPKTGTTYLQDCLWDNRDALAAAGIMLPGRSRTTTSRWVGDLLKWSPGDGPLPPSWRRLVKEVNAWTGHAAIVSHEHIHRATPEQWDALVESFAGARLEVVVTARDVARSVPAQWQSSVRQRYSWTLADYAASVAADGARQEPVGPGFHFWLRQDTPAILNRFIARLSREQVRLVTVPPSGGDPDELWRRFCRACDLVSVPTTPGAMRHESLGAASAEVLRRLNTLPPVMRQSVSGYKKSVNHALSRATLSPRRSEEPALTLPASQIAWAQAESESMIRAIEEIGVEVVGDLDDLCPRPSSKPFVDPDQLPAEELLEAALAGLAGMAARYSQQRAQLEELQKALAEARAQAGAAGAAGQGPTGQGGQGGPSGQGGGGPRAAGLGQVLRRRQRGS